MQIPAMEPDTLAFDSTVTAVRDGTVELDRTYFFAESGGQPPDRGTIDDVPVADVRLADGRVVHELVDEPGFAAGDTVQAQVDPGFRRYCRRAHSASHAVYGAARRRFEAVGYGGFEISPAKVRIDFATPRPIDTDDLLSLERATNRVIDEDRPVTWEPWPAEEVRAHDDIAMNVATEVVETEPTVRVVEIEDWDIAACGGTHVRSTGAIGPVSLTARSNPGEGLTRIEFVVGDERVDRQVAEKRAALAAKTHLDAPVDGVPDQLERIAAERTQLDDRVDALEAALVEARLTSRDARTIERDGHRWRLASVPGADAAAVADALPALVGSLGDVLVATGGDERSHVVVASEGEPAADAVVEAALEPFQGGGGGSAHVAQGGGIDADPETVLEHLLEHYAPTSV